MAFTGVTLFDFFNLKDIEVLKTHFKTFYLATSRGAPCRSEGLGNSGILSQLARTKGPLTVLTRGGSSEARTRLKPKLLLTSP